MGSAKSGLELAAKAAEIRKMAVTLISGGTAGHIGGTLSSCDILTALYYGYMNISPETAESEDRDRFVLSKGHCIEAYLSILCDRGFITAEELATFGKEGSRLYSHPNRELPGVEANTGALGHGLSVAAGMAYEAKRRHSPARVFALLGDGELAEGSVWEAAMFAAAKRLDNLYVFIDRNGLQISGDTEKVMPLEPLGDKFTAFGFDCRTVADGNDMVQLCDALDGALQLRGRPKLIIAKTVKGKGVSFMEGKSSWHHGKLDPDQLALALSELDGLKEAGK